MASGGSVEGRGGQTWSGREELKDSEKGRELDEWWEEGG
jgi:hypothetical protein